MVIIFEIYYNSRITIMLKLAKTSLLTLSIITSSLISSDVLATVDGKNITKQDVQAFISMSAPQARYEQLTPTQIKNITDRLIEKSLFAKLAKSSGIDKKEEYKNNIAKIQDELMVNMWMKTQMDNILVSDSEAKAFYDKNKDKFVSQESIHARHILVKAEKDANEITNALKSLKGEALKIKFIALAKEKSTGPSGPKGGDLGSFPKGKMVPAFEKAVWSLKEGEITTSAVKTQFGYHIIYLEKKNQPEAIPYAKVKDRIIDSMKKQQFAKKIQDMAKELRDKAKIETFIKTDDTKK